MVFGALPQGKLCDCTNNFVLRQVGLSAREFTMTDDEIEQAADLFLTLWQENFRHWALEKDLLPHRELAALMDVATAADASEDCTDG
jgi:hypothetical protein